MKKNNQYEAKAARKKIDLELVAVLIATLGTIIVVLFYFSPIVKFLYPIPSPTATQTSTQIPTLTESLIVTPTPSPLAVSDFLYYMIVLDASERMQESFDGRSKWQVAKNLLVEIINGLNPRAQYSLVVIGGSNSSDSIDPCANPTSPAVAFSPGQSVYDYLGSLQPQGGGSFYRAYTLAKNQLEDLPEDTIRTLIYITGSSDTCETEDEWKALKNLISFPDSNFGIFSQVIILDDNEIGSQTLADQFNSLANNNVNAQAPQSIIQLRQTYINVINNISNYVNTTIATLPSNTPVSTTTDTLTPRPGVTAIIPSEAIPSTTPTTTLRPSPSVELLSFNFVTSGIGCLVDITVQVTGSPATGSFHVWNAFYGPEGEIYPQTTLPVGTDNGLLVTLGGIQPQYDLHEVWFEYNGVQSNHLSGLVCLDQIDFSTLVSSTSTRLVTATFSPTPNPTLTRQAVFSEIDKQLQDTLKANIVYDTPEEMELDESFTIELLLNPSLSPTELIPQIVESGNLVTATAGPSVFITDQAGNLVTSTAETDNLVTDQGVDVNIIASEVEITNRMKAVLISSDPEAFIIQSLHDNSEQVIGSVETTKWRWSITAKKEGTKTLEMVIYRLIKIDGDEYWREVETYRTDIIVKVTAAQWLNKLDWKWIIGIVVSLLLIPAFWRWYDIRKKQDSLENEIKSKKKVTPRRRKEK